MGDANQNPTGAPAGGVTTPEPTAPVTPVDPANPTPAAPTDAPAGVPQPDAGTPVDPNAPAGTPSQPTQ